MSPTPGISGQLGKRCHSLHRGGRGFSVSDCVRKDAFQTFPSCLVSKFGNHLRYGYDLGAKKVQRRVPYKPGRINNQHVGFSTFRPWCERICRITAATKCCCRAGAGATCHTVSTVSTSISTGIFLCLDAVRIVPCKCTTPSILSARQHAALHWCQPCVSLSRKTAAMVTKGAAMVTKGAVI